MDESTFETFEDELGQPLKDVSPPKPLRTARTGGRAEMYTQRRTREEAPALQQVPKMTPREHPVSSATSLRKALSIQNLAQIETPWEGVTLNRCLIIAITILVLTCGLQRINEALRGRKDVAEEFTAVSERHTFIRKAKLPTHEPEMSLWDTFFWWVDDDDDDEGTSKRKSKRASQERASRGFRHRTVPNLRLLKKRETKFSERRGRRDVGEMKERMKRTREKVRKKITEEEQEVEKTEKTKKPVKDSKQKHKKGP
ncbi:uncharacterized protein LOC130553881 [Triplophysa rosa]|uniref:Uncharacterized protein n=1 Tax=Triplophysa rosa TaxID=992332 RepID=A0A9W7WXK3_TRIRA|nr:uncharacterized protein LOC130553881 [Triplophysa rosa]KAI7809986.1 hypothetical protein IRJ41_020683 [Triplophysa rosa]